MYQNISISQDLSELYILLTRHTEILEPNVWNDVNTESFIDWRIAEVYTEKEHNIATHTHTHTGECGGKHVEEGCWSRTQHKTSIASVAVTFPFARPIHTVDVFTKETHSASHCAVVSNQTHLVFRFSFENKTKQNKTIQKASMAIQVGTTKTIKSMLVYVIETIKIDVDRSSWVGIALGGATRNLETRFSIFSCSVWSWWIAFTVVVVVVVVVWNGWSNRIKSGVTFSLDTEEMEREIKKKKSKEWRV